MPCPDGETTGAIIDGGAVGGNTLDGCDVSGAAIESGDVSGCPFAELPHVPVIHERWEGSMSGLQRCPDCEAPVTVVISYFTSFIHYKCDALGHTWTVERFPVE